MTKWHEMSEQEQAEHEDELNASWWHQLDQDNRAVDEFCKLLEKDGDRSDRRSKQK